MEAYENVLRKSNESENPFINADLHVNYGVALQYVNKYSSAIQHFQRALLIEPHFTVADAHLKNIRKYLTAFRDSIRTKGKIHGCTNSK